MQSNGIAAIPLIGQALCSALKVENLLFIQTFKKMFQIEQVYVKKKKKKKKVNVAKIGRKPK